MNMRKFLIFILSHLSASIIFAKIYEALRPIRVYNENDFLQPEESIFIYVFFLAIPFRLLAKLIIRLLLLVPTDRIRVKFMVHGILILLLWLINPHFFILVALIVDAFSFNIINTFSTSIFLIQDSNKLGESK